MKNRLFRIFAWFFWSCYFLTAVIYVRETLNTVQSSGSYESITLIKYPMIFGACLATCLSFLARHFLIIKPYKQGTFNPRSDFLKYFLITVLNLILSFSVIYLGIITYLLGGPSWVLYFLSALGFSLLIFHSPRLGPFTKDISPENKIEDTAAKRFDPFKDFLFLTFFILMIGISACGEDVMIILAQYLGLEQDYGSLLQGLFGLLFFILFGVRAVQLRRKFKNQGNENEFNITGYPPSRA